MSAVANVIVTCALGDGGVFGLNAYLRSVYGSRLTNCRGMEGGSKALDADIWVGAYNRLDVPDLVTQVRTASWDEPYAVRVFVQEPHENSFHQIQL